MMLWNIGSALVKPKYVSLGMYVPNTVLKAALCRSSFRILRVLCPHLISKSEYNSLRVDFLALSGC